MIGPDGDTLLVLYVRIDSLGVIAYSINPKVMCEEVAWLVKGSEPACMQVLRVLEGRNPILQL